MASITEFDMGSFDLDAGGETQTDLQGSIGQQGSLGQGSLGQPQGSGKDAASASEISKEMKKVVAASKRKTDDEVQDHQALVIMLSRYGSSKRFAEFLKSMGFVLIVSHLKKLETDELEEILQRIKSSVDNKNVSMFWQDQCFGGISTTETIVCSTRLRERLKIQGLRSPSC